jgi:hypothetical protein
MRHLTELYENGAIFSFESRIFSGLSYYTYLCLSTQHSHQSKTISIRKEEDKGFQQVIRTS